MGGHLVTAFRGENCARSLFLTLPGWTWAEWIGVSPWLNFYYMHCNKQMGQRMKRNGDVSKRGCATTRGLENYSCTLMYNQRTVRVQWDDDERELGGGVRGRREESFE